MEENRKRDGQVRVCVGKIKAEVGKESLLSSPPGGCSSCKLFIYLFPNKYHLIFIPSESKSHSCCFISLSLPFAYVSGYITSSYYISASQTQLVCLGFCFLHCSTLCHQWVFTFLHISILLRFNNRDTCRSSDFTLHSSVCIFCSWPQQT